jgi:hypothetical protein
MLRLLRSVKGIGGGGSMKLSKSSSSRRGKFEPPEVRDCVYDRAEGVLSQELVEDVKKGGGRKEKTRARKLQRLFGWKKKVKANAEGRNAGVSQEDRPAQKEEEDLRFFMSGGRSPGISASLETLIPKGDNEYRRSSSTESNVGYCLCKDHEKQHSTLKGEVEQALFRSNSKPSSKSRSPVKLSKSTDKSEHSSLSASVSSRHLSGNNITHQNAFYMKEKHQVTYHCSQSTSTSTSTMSSPGSNCSRASSFNIGSIIELSMSAKKLEEREKRERLETEKDRTPSPDPFRPSTPHPIQTGRVRSWASIPLRRKPSIENLKPVAPETVGNAFASPSKARAASQPTVVIPVRKPGPYFKEQMAMPGVVGQGTQTFMVNRERRADRNSGGTGEGGGEKDQQADFNKEMDVFRRNRERRREERRSAGQVMEAGAVGGMTSEGAARGAGVSARQKKRSEGEVKKPFNVDDEPIASGIEWERRMKEGQSVANGFNVDEEPAVSELARERRLKKGQLAAKKSPSEKYREEERAKYWSPK